MITIRYAAPEELVHRWCEVRGETLRDAAINLVRREQWKLGGTAESLRWSSVKLVVANQDAFSTDDRDGPKSWTTSDSRPPTHTRRRAQLVCVSTGSTGPDLLCPPGPPRQVVLNVTVPAETMPGEIELL